MIQILLGAVWTIIDKHLAHERVFSMHPFSLLRLCWLFSITQLEVLYLKSKPTIYVSVCIICSAYYKYAWCSDQIGTLVW